MHIKELAIFAPGKIMKVNLTANLTGAGFGTRILKARTAAERRMAPQSGENAEFTLLSYDATDPENIAADYLASLSSFWTSLGRDGHLIWPVQALKEVYSTSLVLQIPLMMCGLTPELFLSRQLSRCTISRSSRRLALALALQQSSRMKSEERSTVR